MYKMEDDTDMKVSLCQEDLDLEKISTMTSLDKLYI